MFYLEIILLFEKSLGEVVYKTMLQSINYKLLVCIIILHRRTKNLLWNVIGI